MWKSWGMHSWGKGEAVALCPRRSCAFRHRCTRPAYNRSCQMHFSQRKARGSGWKSSRFSVWFASNQAQLAFMRRAKMSPAGGWFGWLQGDSAVLWGWFPFPLSRFRSLGLQSQAEKTSGETLCAATQRFIRRQALHCNAVDVLAGDLLGCTSVG